MSSPSPDLLPIDFGVEVRSTPKSILEAQAVLLGERTGGAVVGDVEVGFGPPDFTTALGSEAVVIAFWAVIPNLQYHRRVLQVAHDPLDLYPAYLLRELIGDGVEVCGGELELLNSLRSVFTSDKFRNLIRSLVAHSK